MILDSAKIEDVAMDEEHAVETVDESAVATPEAGDEASDSSAE